MSYDNQEIRWGKRANKEAAYRSTSHFICKFCKRDHIDEDSRDICIELCSRRKDEEDAVY